MSITQSMDAGEVAVSGRKTNNGACAHYGFHHVYFDNQRVLEVVLPMFSC